MRSIITKPELRQFFRENEHFLWFQEILQEQFNERKLLIGAPDAERLWQVKGISQVLRFIEDPESLLDLLDVAEE